MFILSKFSTKKPLKRNKNCVILGNGPSLTDSVVSGRDFLTKSDLICVNYFPLTDFFQELKPRFFVSCDFVLWDKTKAKYLVEKSEKVFDVIQKVDWEMQLIMPFIAKDKGDWREKIESNPKISVIYYNLTPVEGLFSISKVLFKARLGMPRPHNVMIPAIFHAVNMRYSEVYLIGVEQSWVSDISVDNENVVFIGQAHFYKEDQNITQPMKNKEQKYMNITDIFKMFMIIFKGYMILNEYAKHLGVRIYNATPNSFIDAFQRKKIPNSINEKYGL